ncbi:hypothetical protein HMPREF9447_01765 [Bacteroides oleiciplenus YIT 12058]|uniref:Uncharacterized protein n=1 Tax=Bacteroides oleiciplenus YIT 12058 TaxID=742727 RepID=K9EHE9_9BACE|nr:hypothetical protein HMPREF9447_01765 [Bacteroides oleiciplenus YIT 12058]
MKNVTSFPYVSKNTLLSKNTRMITANVPLSCLGIF